MDNIEFTSTDEALQYLSDHTGKKVIVAGITKEYQDYLLDMLPNFNAVQSKMDPEYSDGMSRQIISDALNIFYAKFQRHTEEVENMPDDNAIAKE